VATRVGIGGPEGRRARHRWAAKHPNPASTASRASLHSSVALNLSGNGILGTKRLQATLPIVNVNKAEDTEAESR